MFTNLIKLKKEFSRIKEMGWIKSCKNDFGGIGITFEKLLGIQTNELEIPDFGEIELKTKTDCSDEYITLFNCVPTGPHYHEVERLKDEFGYYDSKYKQYKVLNTFSYSGRLTKTISKYYMSLYVDKGAEKIFLCIYNAKKEVIEKQVYWDFDILKEKLYRKLKYIAVVNAKKRYLNGNKHFHYYKMQIYKLKDFNSFIESIAKGKIRVSFKIGIYTSGLKFGKIHDRGTGFAININDIESLFDIVETVK